MAQSAAFVCGFRIDNRKIRSGRFRGGEPCACRPLNSLAVVWARGVDPHVAAFFSSVTILGLSGWIFVATLALACIALAARARAASLRARVGYGLLASRCLYFFAVNAGAGIGAQVAKHILGRARPRLMGEMGAFHFDWLSVSASLASFPSGHTVTAFACATALSFFWPRGRWFLFALACVIGVSRVLVGAHYPTDVLGGAMIGAACAWGLALTFGVRKIAFVGDAKTRLTRLRVRGPGLILDILPIRSR